MSGGRVTYNALQLNSTVLSWYCPRSLRLATYTTKEWQPLLRRTTASFIQFEKKTNWNAIQLVTSPHLRLISWWCIPGLTMFEMLALQEVSSSHPYGSTSESVLAVSTWMLLYVAATVHYSDRILVNSTTLPHSNVFHMTTVLLPHDTIRSKNLSATDQRVASGIKTMSICSPPSVTVQYRHVMNETYRRQQ